jgi:iron complex outermembrane receptor protein
LQRSSNQIVTRLSDMLRAIGTGVALALCTAPGAQAVTDAPAALSAAIPEQPLARALEAFTRQTGLHLVYVSRLVRSQKSHAVAAGLRADEALARLLQGTGLKFEFLTARSVRILADVPPPAAQSLPATFEESQPLLPVVLVTGSRIPVPANVRATSPLQVVTSQDIALAGYADSIDVISTLPQMIMSGADMSNYSSPTTGSVGIATADLRGLGPQRTIVLINGRRLGLGDPNTGNQSPAPDLDQIPLEMVDRVEVLTGGASATYGSDAVAGVVNFILKDHVQGVQISGQYGFSQHTQHNSYLQGVQSAAGITAPQGTVIDGFKRDLSVLAGTSFHDGAGQVTGYFSYHGQNPVYGSARDFSNCAAFSANQSTGVPTQGGLLCGGSFASNQFVTQQGTPYSVVGNQLVPWPAAGSVPPAVFNYQPYTTIQRGDARYQAGLLARIELQPAVKPYFEFSFMEDQTLTELAPSGLFQSNNYLTADGRYRVNCSNPLLSTQEAAILCTPAQIAADKAHPGSVSADVDIGWRNMAGGGRLFSFDHKNYRVVGGIGGNLDDAWSYDAYALYYYTSLFQANKNYLNYAAANSALQVTTDATGRPVCISGGSCVPYDIFTTGAVTAQQLAYLTTTGTDGGANSERIVAANVTGQLGRYGIAAPWARDDVAFNVGVEYRTETLRFAPDAAERSGDLAGFGNAAVAIDKRVSVSEGFLELRVPVAQERPLLEDLTIDAGYRYSAYTTAGATNTYKAELQFAPLLDLRLRASFERVVRAPNLIELYSPASYGPSQVVFADPCAPTQAGATHAAASLSQCMHTGVTPVQYGNGIGPDFGGTSTIVQCVGNCGVINGGNPRLVPETARTWSLGMTFTPRTIPTLTGSVDYFHILLTDKIGTVPDSVTLQQCLATGDPSWCSQIVRTPAGALSGSTVAGGGYILQTAINTGVALASGVDLQVNYRSPLAGGWGALAVSLTGSWLQHNSSTPYRSAASYDCAGLFGNSCLGGAVIPTWRHNLRLTWETPWNVQFSAQWRFIGRTDFDNNSSQPALQNQEEGFFDPVLTHIPSYSYLDLSAIWAVTRQLQVRAGVSNVFDKDPPIIPSDVTLVGPNTFPAYDILGRNIFIGLRATL